MTGRHSWIINVHVENVEECQRFGTKCKISVYDPQNFFADLCMELLYKKVQLQEKNGRFEHFFQALIKPCDEDFKLDAWEQSATKLEILAVFEKMVADISELMSLDHEDATTAQDYLTLCDVTFRSDETKTENAEKAFVRCIEGFCRKRGALFQILP